jgi:hypothetical protein
MVPAKVKRRLERGVVGSQVDPYAYTAGQPDCMLTPHKRAYTNGKFTHRARLPGFRVVFDVQFNCTAQPWDVSDYFSAIAASILALQQSGFDCSAVIQLGTRFFGFERTAVLQIDLGRVVDLVASGSMRMILGTPIVMRVCQFLVSESLRPWIGQTIVPQNYGRMYVADAGSDRHVCYVQAPKLKPAPQGNRNFRLDRSIKWAESYLNTVLKWYNVAG